MRGLKGSTLTVADKMRGESSHGNCADECQVSSAVCIVFEMQVEGRKTLPRTLVPRSWVTELRKRRGEHRPTYGT